jgi:tRNA1Val (adenine37-N6)-methyltransferase
MARGPFHFKAFSVEQDGAAMKVGTDGIVLGCWTEVDGVRTVVDAGAGNGYVGIMLMQRMTEGKVIGCELEPDAAKPAAENYADQPFEGKTGIAWEGAIQDAASAMPDLAGTVDLMISNPPFFRDKPKSPIRARNLSRHDDTLTMGDLVKAAAQLLRPGGRLCTIWPHDRLDEWTSWAAGWGFHPTKLVHVQTMRHLPPKRFLSEWTLRPSFELDCVEDTLTLEGTATLDFTDQYLEYVTPYLRGT